ncbi:MAG: hypothetical protein M3542_02675, partial [Acidobacteriota bacterium]|nr:hypothetical protein [Acidobacteriota bacterium]
MSFLLLSLLAAAISRPIEIDVRPGPAETFRATLVGPAQGARGGAFTGSLSVNGSSVEIPVSARAVTSGDRLRLPVTLRYADVPSDWANRFHPQTFDYRLSGKTAAGVA